jgi:hypothetical protein
MRTGTAVDEETARPSGPGTADTYWKNVRQQLIVLEICLENFSEAFTERSLKMSGVLNSSFADVAKRTRIS